MCPDRQIISLYIDDELPSPWKEKVEAHLDSCESCRSRLNDYRKLRGFFQSSQPKIDDEAIKNARERVWANLPFSNFENEQNKTFINNRMKRRQGWKRSISLPVPVAAAAAAVFVLAAFLAIRGFYFSANNRTNEIAAGADLQGIVPIPDMTGLLQYLASQESRDYIIIQLPESRSFTSSGEPALIRAADYTGRTSRRRNSNP